MSTVVHTATAFRADSPGTRLAALRKMRPAILLGLALGAIVTAALLPRIPQSPSFHRYADSRALYSVPNAVNVGTNVLFVVVGVLGLARRERPAWRVFFAALVLTGAGSTVYHWAPSDATLVWDRLPLSVLSTSLLAAVVEERIGPRLLWPLVMLGAASVLFWRWRDDLSAYIVIQVAAPLAIALLVLLYPGPGTFDLLLALGIYGAARLCEIADAPIYAMGGIVSGHSLKHVLAALGAAVILRMLRRRLTEGRHPASLPP